MRTRSPQLGTCSPPEGLWAPWDPRDEPALCPPVLSPRFPCRRVNGVLDDKPLSVPRDINLRLDTSPITAVDALGNPPWGQQHQEHPQSTHPMHPPHYSRSRPLGHAWVPTGPPGRGDVSPCPPSAAVFPGVPVVCGLRRLLHRRVRLHRGLLLPGGPPEGDEHRGAVVPADGRLLRVSSCRGCPAVGASSPSPPRSVLPLGGRRRPRLLGLVLISKPVEAEEFAGLEI